jgi:predicted CXXCH cytochrome family protein
MKSNKLFLVFLGLMLVFGLSVFTPALAKVCTDNDGDTYAAERKGCGPQDCDDTDPAVNPGAAEVCDGKDTNCDGSRPWNDYDIDQDGYAVCAGDCNDQDAAANPGATEICGDLIDNNCNNQTDETGCTCPDADGDGHPAAFCGGDDCDDSDPTVFQNCPGCTDGDGDGFSLEGGNCGPVDCDDTDPAVNPGATEVCDGKDTNCDGSRSWNDYDIDEDSYAVCNGDCNDQDAAVNPDATELCGDLIDNNCNNATDEAGCLCPDADGDGHPAAYCGGDDCDDTDPTVFQNCPGCTDADGDGYSLEGGNCGPVDCDDTDPNVNPGEPVDVCDGKDTNCDGTIPWNDYDFDGDGYALCNGECDDRPDGADGIPGTADDGANINPGMLERTIRDAICSDGLDNDCDTKVDETDTGCFAPSCDSDPTTKDFPHFFTLLNPDDTVHPDNNSLLCGKCHGAGLQDPIRGACQRCHADSSDPSDPLNGTTKDQYPGAPPYGYGTAPNVKIHSSDVVGTKYGNWTMGAMGCSVCHNPHSQEQNNIFGTDYGMFVKEYICYDNDETGGSVEEFVEFTSATGDNSFADGPPYIENVCNMCHTRTNHHQRDGDAPGGQDHNNGADCMQCHAHSKGFKPSGAAPPHDFISNCEYCHVSVDDFTTKIPNSQCEQCHTPDGVLKLQFPADPPDGFGTAPDVLTHSDVNGSGKYVYSKDCVDCHEPMFGTPNIAHVRTDLSAAGGGTNIVFTQRTGTDSFADGPPYDENVCNSCHTMTNHHRNESSQPFPNQDHNNNADCALCHPHGDAFLPTGGDCLACHNQSPPAGSSDPDRRQIVEGTAGDGMGDFVKASHHVTDGTSTQIVTAESCEVCHDQSIHTTFGDGQSVLLNDQDGGAAYIYDGDGASVEGFCVSCHDADGSLINGSQPFIASGDTNSPPDMGWSAGVVSHSTFDACFNCHAQGHGSDFEKILAEDNEPGLCFNCHDADGPASTDLEGEFAKQFGHPVTAASSSIQCLDCHNPHQAEPGTHTPDGQWYPSSPNANTNLVSGVLSGVMGVEPSPWAPAWTKTDSYTVLDPAEKEYQVCFKCHARYSHQ